MGEKDSFSKELPDMEQQIVLRIKADPVPAVSREEIKKACEVAAAYYTERQDIWNRGFWKVTFSCLTIKSAFFWILAAFLLGSCVVASSLATRFAIEPLAFMTAISPVPVLAFAIRELQYRDDNLVQLEKTCQYAPARIYVARMWIGMVFNALFVLSTGKVAFSRYGSLLQLYLCSFIAMFFVGAIALFLLSFLDNALPLSFIMAAWVLGAACFLCQCETLDAVMGVSVTVLMGMLLFSLGLFAVASIKTTTKLYAGL